MTRDTHGTIFGCLMLSSLLLMLAGIAWGLGGLIYENWSSVAGVIVNLPGWQLLTIAGMASCFTIFAIGKVLEPGH